MKLLKDDPRLLQFVLDEISQSDRLVVESAMSSQPEIAAEVQTLKNIYSDVSAAETLPNDLRLSSERRKELFAQTIDKKAFSFFGLPSTFKYWGYSAGGLIAATFAFLVFSHSLKNEVKDQIASVRPTIPADSDLAAAGAPPMPAQPTTPSAESSDKIAFEEKSIPEPAKKITVDEIAEDSQTENLYATSGASKDLKQDEAPQAAVEQEAVSAAPPSEFDENRPGAKEIAKSGALNEIARVEAQSVQSAVRSKKMFASSKSGGAINTFGPQHESKKAESKELKSAFGSGEIGTKGKSNSADSELTTHQFEVIISSRALEAEQIRTMTDFVKSCLIKNYIGRELKIEFLPQEDKFNFTNPNPTGAELNFAKCSQKAFGPPIAPYIKVISVELKSTFSK